MSTGNSSCSSYHAKDGMFLVKTVKGEKLLWDTVFRDLGRIRDWKQWKM